MRKAVSPLIGLAAVGMACLVAFATPVAMGATPSYSTSFDSDENPISEGGRWFNNTGTFSAVRTMGGVAFGTHGGVDYDDSIAHLSGFPSDQYIQATVYKSGSFTVNQEVQLLLRMTTTQNRVRGYEILLTPGGGSGQIMRWDGPMGGGFFTQIGSADFGGSLNTGDVIKAQMVGSTISVYKNGVQIGSVNDSTFASGDPGIAFFTRDASGEQNTRFGWSDVTAAGIGGVTAVVPKPPVNVAVE